MQTHRETDMQRDKKRDGERHKVAEKQSAFMGPMYDYVCIKEGL